MSYAASAALARDPTYAGRVQAAISTEAQGRPAGDQFAGDCLTGPERATDRFMPWLSTAPGFADAFTDTGSQDGVTDGMILSALQTNWDTVAALYTIDPPV